MRTETKQARKTVAWDLTYACGHTFLLRDEGITLMEYHCHCEDEGADKLVRSVRLVPEEADRDG